MSEKLKNLKELCREHDMRLTPQRLEIFRAVDGLKDHPSVLDVFNKVHKLHPTISLDTVYRTLDTFEQWGLIRKLQFFVDKIRYDGDLSPHHHFICKECKTIWDFTWPDFHHLSLPSELKKIGIPENKEVIISGICAQCAG